MEIPIGHDGKCPDELWVKISGATGSDYKLPNICSYPCSKATCGNAVCSKNYRNSSILFFVLFKDPIAQEVLEIIKQDWNHFVLVKIKGLKDLNTSEGYAI